MAEHKRASSRELTLNQKLYLYGSIGNSKARAPRDRPSEQDIKNAAARRKIEDMVDAKKNTDEVWGR